MTFFTVERECLMQNELIYLGLSLIGIILLGINLILLYAFGFFDKDRK